MLLLPLLACGPAQAHQPDIEPVGEIVAPDGRQLRLELLFGDGILFPDPGRGQLRDEQGRVVGRTPVDVFITASCTSDAPPTCRVLLPCSRLLPGCAWVPDFDSVDWEARTFMGANRRTGDPYPEYDKAPAPVGFVRDFAHEWAEASFIQKPFMVCYLGPFLALSLLIGCWVTAIYAIRRLRLAELRRYGRATGSRVLGAAAWLGVALVALPVLGLDMLVGYWGLPVWLLPAVLFLAVILRRSAERRLLPPEHWARSPRKRRPAD